VRIKVDVGIVTKGEGAVCAKGLAVADKSRARYGQCVVTKGGRTV